MNAIDLCVFLTSYTLVVAVIACSEWLRTRRATSLITAATAMLAVIVVTVIGYYVKPGDNYLTLLIRLVEVRDFSAAASVGLGVACALSWVARWPDRFAIGSSDRRAQMYRQGITPFVLATSVCGVILFASAFIRREVRGVQRDPASRMNEPGFVIDKVADLDYPPIRVAADRSGKLFVSYDYFEDAGTMGGGIVGLTEDKATGQFHQRVVADSPLLMRCYGLATREDSLFVSRTGFSARAKHGTVAYDNTGAITELRDLDGDGYFEYAHDVVTGLPGARGPDTMQQNNGICFGPDGSLFITTANASNRSLAVHPWEGAVLRVDPDFATPEVFAKGFRNPFGIAFGPDDELFVTDNDTDENPGDELNHVIRGNHYGHPYVVPNESEVDSEGFCDPIFVGPHEWNFLGLVYATSPALPEKYRNCLYVADFMQHAIWRMKLDRNGSTYSVRSVERFASISSPIDITVTAAGEFFVISRNTRNLYRIRPQPVTTDGADG